MTTEASKVEGPVIQPEQAETELVSVPRNIGELMVRQDALHILERQIRILGSLRRASIAMTFPEDWLLFRAEDPRTGGVSQYGYLQDKGCQRIRDIWGIDTFNVGPSDEKGLPGLRMDASDGSFSIVMIGDGRCHKTGQVVERIEGGRSSRDDAVIKLIQSEERAGRKITEAQLDLTVRKNARANLEGNIVRRLTGMSGVPIEELADCWKDHNKNVAQCILGRGYGQGQKAEARAKSDGGNPAASGEDYTTDLPPICDVCTAKRKDGKATEFRLVSGGVSKKTGRAFPAFWACPNHAKCMSRTINAADWHKDLLSQSTSKEAAELPETSPREPGEDPEGVPF